MSDVRPELDPREWVFCSIDPASDLDLDPVATFAEDEGLTVVIERRQARALGLDERFPSRRITLLVYSDLNAVGFLAPIATALAKRGIAVNTFSAVHHDHLFVPIDRADEAMRVILAISSTVR